MEGGSEWLVVCEDVEATAFDEVAEALDCSKDCEKLPVVRAVLAFRLGELAGEEGDWLTGVVDELLDDVAGSSV